MHLVTIYLTKGKRRTILEKREFHEYPSDQEVNKMLEGREGAQFDISRKDLDQEDFDY